MDSPEIRYFERHGRGRYEVVVGPGEDQPLMTVFKASDDLMIIEHTGVPESQAGKGYGLALVLRAVEDARASGWKIRPLCPYAAAEFRRHPEWHDVLER